MLEEIRRLEHLLHSWREACISRSNMDLFTEVESKFDHIAMRDLAPGMAERLKIMVNSQDWRANRTIRTPFYLTDLGVRKMLDPSIFFDEHVRLGLLPLEFDEAATVRAMRNVEIAMLSKQLDSLVLMVGSYQSAAEVVRLRRDDILRSQDPTLLVFSGVLLAALGDEACLPMLSSVLDIPGVSAEQAFAAMHRRAAAQVKRFNRFDDAEKSLDLAEQIVGDAEARGEISVGDSRALRDVSYNLRALIASRVKDFDRAKELLHDANSMPDVSAIKTLNSSEVARYVAQRNINRAQLFAPQNPDLALLQLEENITFCEGSAPEYLSETYATAAYGAYLGAAYEKTLEYSIEAIRLIAQEASPTRLRQARNVQLAAVAQSGRHDAADSLLRIAESDVLGFQVGGDQECS